MPRALLSPEKAAGWLGEPEQIGSPASFEKRFFEPAGEAYERKLQGLSAFEEVEDGKDGAGADDDAAGADNNEVDESVIDERPPFHAIDYTLQHHVAF